MIRLLVVGKVKESFFREAILEYQKRLSRYTKLEIIEVADGSYENPELNQAYEGKLLLKQIQDKEFVITLEIGGKHLDSIGFSKQLDFWLMESSNLVFVIGGSDGLSPMVRSRSNYALSFSMMTFPHQLFRILVLEQIYRAFRISHNESYHK